MHPLAPQVSAGNRYRYDGLKEPCWSVLDVICGESGCISINADVLVSITNIDGGTSALVTSLSDDEAEFAIASLDIPQTSRVAIDPATFDSRMMNAIASNRNTSLENAKAIQIFDDSSRPGEVFIFRVTLI